MHRIHGQCHCGNITVEVGLPKPPQSYSPRVCDCDFCRKHGAAYLSDIDGSLNFTITGQTQAAPYRQGSGVAEFIICRQCGVLVGAFHVDGSRTLGVVNVRALDGVGAFGQAQPISPKTLTAAQKIERWRTLWFPRVGIERR